MSFPKKQRCNSCILCTLEPQCISDAPSRRPTSSDASSLHHNTTCTTDKTGVKVPCRLSSSFRKPCQLVLVAACIVSVLENSSMPLPDAGALSSSRKIGCVSVFGAPSARLQLLKSRVLGCRAYGCGRASGCRNSRPELAAPTPTFWNGGACAAKAPWALTPGVSRFSERAAISLSRGNIHRGPMFASPHLMEVRGPGRSRPIPDL